MAVYSSVVCDLCGKVIKSSHVCDFGGSIRVESGTLSYEENSRYPEDYILHNVCADCLKATILYLKNKRKFSKGA